MGKKRTKHVFENAEPLDLAATLDCGQAFRWVSDDRSKGESNDRSKGESVDRPEDLSYLAVVEGEEVRVWKDGGALAVECDNLPAEFWRDYFALDLDYAAMHGEFRKNATLAKCVDFAPGIRVLRQPFFETLISFIISQNNNIPRIKRIIGRLCGTFGTECSDGKPTGLTRPRIDDGNNNGRVGDPSHIDVFTFPTAERLTGLTLDDLACLRSGYRAPAIIDAAKRVASGELNAAELRGMPFDEARKKLLKVYGVGPKIADCVLLFGLGRFEAFPIDVWMRRAMAELFPDGLPEAVKPYAGIAQQYIFHYARNNLRI